MIGLMTRKFFADVEDGLFIMMGIDGRMTNCD
jgi:hypothetical protein